MKQSNQKPVTSYQRASRRINSWFLVTGYWLLSIPFLLTGCGYTQKTVLPENIQSIYVDTVKNEIDPRGLYAYVPGLEMKITDAVIDRLERDGNLKVTSKDKADAILESKLLRFNQEGVRFSSLEDVEEYRLYLTISMQLKSRKTGQIIWSENEFNGNSEYFVSQVRSLSREQAADRAVQNLAYNVVDRIVEDW